MDPSPKLSSRLAEILDVLPLRPGRRVLEIGGAPGPLARAIAARVGPTGFVLVVDRSERGTAATERACAAEIRDGLLGVRCSPVEAFALEPHEPPFDLAIANRVGAFDGRQRAAAAAALEAITAATTPGAPFYVDGRLWA
ncbi:MULTISPECIES: SAM-dependent methyltransferase [Aeromicrobium]|uniref:SAM-dependent methyltransferase n=1 Tax=Aeromicrobium TaxID=2040 RepID=UPI00257D5EC9|nr:MULTISPECIES: SAM-dependent methyltransferase [Aeromicrobium]